jgi:hypothetical protein
MRNLSADCRYWCRRHTVGRSSLSSKVDDSLSHVIDQLSFTLRPCHRSRMLAAAAAVAAAAAGSCSGTRGTVAATSRSSTTVSRVDQSPGLFASWPSRTCGTASHRFGRRQLADRVDCRRRCIGCRRRRLVAAADIRD